MGIAEFIIGRAFARPVDIAESTLHHVRDTSGICSRRRVVICPSGGLLTGVSSFISDFPKNISVPIYPETLLELSPSYPTRGAYRDRHGRGVGGGGRGSVRRATWLQGGLAKGP